jgi:hypothetical protein
MFWNTAAENQPTHCPYFGDRLTIGLEHGMECGRCTELELLYLNRSEEFISLVNRQSCMFRNVEAERGRELDEAIIASRSAMNEGLRGWAEHRESHFQAIHG